MFKRRRRVLATGTLVVILIGLPLISGCGSSSASPASASSPACSISYQDIEIHLSSGDVSCTQVEQERSGLGELWQSGGLTSTSGVPDPPETACTLTQSGQTATITYGSTLGDATEADLICTDFTGEGWTQQQAAARPQAVEPQAGATGSATDGSVPGNPNSAGTPLAQVKRKLRAALQRAAYHRCANVNFTDPYTHSAAAARVAIHRGSVSCATARTVIGTALSTPPKSSGETSQWFVDGWDCSSGGDGTITACNEQDNLIAGTTPTAGGYWPTP